MTATNAAATSIASAPAVHSDASLRQDIQAMRGVAVLAVVLYHSGLLPLRGGYLGVDMFFVISGYLITRNVVSGIDRGRFSFADFYLRRARRLLPAALCTFGLTAVLAAFTLTSSRWQDFQEQLWGALSFTANFVLPAQSGYFESAAHFKPLLHTWSLSVEEQYYLLAPALLVALRPSWRVPVLVGLAVSSLAFCVLMVTAAYSHWRWPDTDTRQLAFYLLPTRAWEMLAGSILACVMLRRTVAVPPWAKWSAMAALCALFVAPLDAPHPRTDALLVVLLTTLLLTSGSAWIGHSPAVHALARVGDWSYSLYLVHWPLFALAASAYIGDVPLGVRACLVAAALALAWAQYRFVEERFRHRRGRGWRAVLAFGVGTLAIATLPMAVHAVRPDPQQPTTTQIRESTRGLSAFCAQAGGVRNPAACSSGASPRIAVWGDSYAMQLVSGLAQMPEAATGVLQLTKAACAPIPDVASIDAQHDETWARGCLDFSSRALDLLVAQPSITHVVLGSPYSGYLDDGPLTLYTQEGTRTDTRRLALDRLAGAIIALQAAGKKVLLVAPPPRPGFDAGACIEQQASGLLLLGRRDCDFMRQDYEIRQRGIFEGLREVAQQTGVPLHRFDDLICDPRQCRTSDTGNRPLYKDDGHLTAHASRALVPRLGLNLSAQGPDPARP